MEKQISLLMEKLKINREEALQLIEDDKAIDKGEKLFELSDEQKKAVKKMTNSGTRKKPFVPDLKPRERKENPTKAGIIAEIAKFLTENSQFSTENVEITNKERMISFRIGENAYEITLVQKRKPKN